MKKLGTLLVEEQMINEDQLLKALEEQKTTGDFLGEVLVRLGFISEESLYRFLSIQHGLEFNPLDNVDIPPQVAKLVPATIAWKYRAIPVSQDNGTLVVATSQPDDLSLFYLPKELKLPTGIKLKVVIAPSSQVNAILEKSFPKTGDKIGGDIQSAQDADSLEAEGLLQNVEQEMINPEDVNLELLDDRQSDEEDDDKGKDLGPLIKLCDYIIVDGVHKRASDIHISPYEKKIVLKYRIDGSLIEFPAPPVAYKRRVATRFKLMAGLNIIEKRLPQDGRIHMTIDGKPVDVRIATMPTRWGENLTMRIVDQSSTVLNIDEIGFEPDQLAQFKKAVSQPYGMVFVTGPTASGKTTTIFAALNHINTPTKNIVTVEDPVEFRLPHIVQIQVDPNAGRTFASVLRSFLRHDPNIMLVGEIRDPETADIAVKASLTGHLVISSLHTNDAPSSIMRLVDLGIDPAYVGSSVLAVASQRLLKRICLKCKAETAISREELVKVGLKPEEMEGKKFYKGAGCAECNKSGYKGRMAVFEVVPMTGKIRKIIFEKGSINRLRAAIKEEGLITIRDAAVIKWMKGFTTLEEVLAETYV